MPADSPAPASPAPRRYPITAEGDERTPDGTIWWLYRHDDGRRIALSNPRIEADDCEGDVFYAPTFDAMKVNDADATDDEEDELYGLMRKVLREEDWSR